LAAGFRLRHDGFQLRTYGVDAATALFCDLGERASFGEGADDLCFGGSKVKRRPEHICKAGRPTHVRGQDQDKGRPIRRPDTSKVKYNKAVVSTVTGAQHNWGFVIGIQKSTGMMGQLESGVVPQGEAFDRFVQCQVQLLGRGKVVRNDVQGAIDREGCGSLDLGDEGVWSFGRVLSDYPVKHLVGPLNVSR